MCGRKIYVICLVQLFRQLSFNAPANTSYSFTLSCIISGSLQYIIFPRDFLLLSNFLLLGRGRGSGWESNRGCRTAAQRTNYVLSYAAPFSNNCCTKSWGTFLINWWAFLSIVVRSRYRTFLYGIRQTGMAMPEFTHCISQYYPNTGGKYVQKQKQTLLLFFIFTVQVC